MEWGRGSRPPPARSGLHLPAFLLRGPHGPAPAPTRLRAPGRPPAPPPGPRSRPRVAMPKRVFRPAEPQPAAQAGHPPGKAAGKTRHKSRPRAERSCDPVRSPLRSPSAERAHLEVQVGRPNRSEARRGPETSGASVFSSHPHLREIWSISQRGKLRPREAVGADFVKMRSRPRWRQAPSSHPALGCASRRRGRGGRNSSGSREQRSDFRSSAASPRPQRPRFLREDLGKTRRRQETLYLGAREGGREEVTWMGGAGGGSIHIPFGLKKTTP